MDIPKDVTIFAEEFSKKFHSFKTGQIQHSQQGEITVEFPVCDEPKRFRKIWFYKGTSKKMEFYLQGWHELALKKYLTPDVLYFFVVWSWLGIEIGKVDFTVQDMEAIAHCKAAGKSLRAIYLANAMLLNNGTVDHKERLQNMLLASKL